MGDGVWIIVNGAEDIDEREHHLCALREPRQRAAGALCLGGSRLHVEEGVEAR